MRQFIIGKNPDKNGIVELIGKDYRYLRQVLRVKPGDMLNARVEDGSLRNFTVASVDDSAKKVIIQICAPTSMQNDSITRGVSADAIQNEVSDGRIEYWLFQFLPKFQKFEQIVKQATECGIRVIVPVIGEFSEKSSAMSLSDAKFERLARIVKEARQQSGSPVATEVMPAMKLEDAIELWNKHLYESEKKDIGIVLSERNENTDCVQNVIGAKFSECEAAELKNKGLCVCVAVGCEGGISPEEIRFLLDKKFSAIHFEGNILRCETAAVYGIAVVQSEVNYKISGNASDN